jgi:hypothetical protein
VTAPIETSATSGAPSLDGIAIASGFVPASAGPPSGCGSEQARLGEPAGPVAERPGREAALGDDDPGAPGRRGKRRADDRVQDEVAERAPSVPALEALVGEHALRPRGGIELDRLEPRDAGEPVAVLAAPFGVLEVGQEDIDGPGVEAEPAEPLARLLPRQPTSRGP